jgi:hypothetical protein
MSGYAGLYRDRVCRAGGYRLRTRLKYRKCAVVLAAIAFKTHYIGVRPAIDLSLAVPVDPVIRDRGACLELSVGTRCGVPRDQLAVRCPFDDSDTHPYASVDRL